MTSNHHLCMHQEPGKLRQTNQPKKTRGTANTDHVRIHFFVLEEVEWGRVSNYLTFRNF